MRPKMQAQLSMIKFQGKWIVGLIIAALVLSLLSIFGVSAYIKVNELVKEKRDNYTKLWDIVNNCECHKH